MTLVVFLVVLSFLVLIHELGHFVFAKIFGVKTEEFGLGYPPRAKFLFRKWRTDFTLNWLPFGGFVRLAGEERKPGSMADSPQMFYSKPRWQRVVILMAGAVMNFLFGVLAFSVIYSISGIPTEEVLDRGVVITQVSEGSPAQESGLEAEDVILVVTYNNTPSEVVGLDSFIDPVKTAAGESVDLTIERDGAKKVVSVYVRNPDEIPEGDGAIGVGISSVKFELRQFPLWQMPFRGAWVGINSAIGFGLLILGALGSMVSELFSSGTVPQDVAGPVGIVYTASREGLLSEGYLAVLNFAGILSINLAIVNVLPIPALDGGRVFFVLLEKVLGGRFKAVYEQYANLAGMVLLLALIFLISVRDVGVILKDAGVL